MVIIGLTGLIAAGKSAVADVLAGFGAEVIDCDRLAHQALAPGSAGLAQVIERFGAALLQPDGSLDRPALGRLVFDDAKALAALEAIVHPLVAELREQRLAASAAEVAVVEAIKLVEVGFHRRCASLWVVTAPPAVRLARLIECRGWSEEVARQRLAAQGGDAEKLRLANEVIVNDGSLEWLTRQAAAAWQRTLEAVAAG